MNEQALKDFLAQKVARGEMTQQQADAVLARFASGELPKPEDFLNTAPYVGSVSAAPKTALEGVVNNPQNVQPLLVNQAEAELAQRKEIQDQTFLESLTNPASLERMGQAVLKGPAQTVIGVTKALPGLALKGAGWLTGSETASQAGDNALNDAAQLNQGVNNRFGSSDPLTPQESFMEILGGSIVPGAGAVTTAVTAGANFGISELIRELTSDKNDDYSTIFDSKAKTDNPGSPFTSPLVTVPLIAVAGVLGLKGISAMRNSTVISAPKIKDIADFDKFAPHDLVSIETSKDAATAYIVDSQTALTNLVKKAGIANPDDIETRISTTTHSAGNTRVRSALSSGHLDVDGHQYSVKVPVKQLFDAALALEQNARAAVNRFINIHDMIDDARIALTKNQPGNHVQTIASLTAQMHRLRQQFPIVDQFHAAYKDATKAVRDFLEGDVLDPVERQWLDTNRPNYVPLNMSPVDYNAPLLERLNQTQTTKELENEDWFLQTRNSAGNYNIDERADPFDMLTRYTEAALRLGMKNNTRLAVVDALLNSNVQNTVAAAGKNLIRLVDENDDLAGNANRLVQVRRAGKTETYLTSAGQAAMLKFDPYIARYPALFIPKRIFENTVAGPLSITFAPITALRDAVLAPVAAKPGTKVAGPVGVLSAIPKQAWAKAQEAISNRISAGLLADEPFIPTSIWSAQGQAAFADRLSQNYLNSIYHQLQSAGGFDASIMKSNIAAGQSFFGEISRTLRDSPTMYHPALSNAVTRFGLGTVQTMVHGFKELFNIIQDAPRYAAAEKTMKAGASPEQAALLAKSISGDMSRSGMVHNPKGVRIGFDTTDRGATSIVTKGAGTLFEFGKESMPFVNPALQGTRRVLEQFYDNPVKTLRNAWLYYGLPSVAIYGWNEMLGKEYNDYAQDRRSARDVATNLYIGLPGKPPEEGIEIPIAHEMTPFSSPYSTALHMWNRGEGADYTSAAMATLARNIMSNLVPLSTPVAVEAVSNLGGVSPNEMFGLSGGGFAIREDDIGFLPQNLEMMSRTLFGSMGNLAIETMYALAGDTEKYGDFNNFITTIVNDVGRRTPVLKNVAGMKTSNVSFSIPMEYDKQKTAALEEAMKYWREFYNPDVRNADGLMQPSSSKTYTKDKGLMDGHDDLPYIMPGPSQLDAPTNPFIELFGGALKQYADTNGIGMSGLDDRLQKYNEYKRLLRSYNAGDRDAIAQWQQELEAIKQPNAEDTANLQSLIEDHNLDLTKYTDRVKLINLIEAERSFVLSQKLEAVKAVEMMFTKVLRKNGLIGPDQYFRIENDLKPFDDAPMGIDPAKLQAAINQ